MWLLSRGFAVFLILAAAGRVEGVDLLLARLPSELPHARRPAIRATGGTNLEAGLRRALADGNPTRGKVHRAGDVLHLLGKRKVRIHTIGRKAAFRLMKEIAKKTGGRCGVL